MNNDTVEYGWKQMEKRLNQRFDKYFRNDPGTGECKEMNVLKQLPTHCQKDKEHSEMN